MVVTLDELASTWVTGAMTAAGLAKPPATAKFLLPKLTLLPPLDGRHVGCVKLFGGGEVFDHQCFRGSSPTSWRISFVSEHFNGLETDSAWTVPACVQR
jgi:hypothetical protein